MTDTSHILIVDDDPLFQKVLKRQLNGWNYEIAVGASGQEAIDFVNQNSVDLVLLDIGLPDMEGHDVLEHIKRKRPETLVIMITGDASLESSVEALRGGAYDYLRKPFKSLELLKTTQNALDHKKAQSDRRQAQQALKEHLAHVEDLVVERTAELKKANEQLEQELLERKHADQALQESQERYRNIFETVPVSIWEEDHSELKAAIDDLQSQGVEDFRSYLDENPDFLRQAAQMIKVKDVNDAALELYRAEDKKQLLGSLDKLFVKEKYPAFKKELIAVAEGRSEFVAESMGRTLKGDSKHMLVKHAIPAEKEKFSNMLVTIVDITELKRAQAALKKAYDKLEQKVRERTADLRGLNKRLKGEIEERQETALALQKSEEEYRTLVSNIPGAVYRCTLDPEGTMHFISDAIEEICGYPASNFIENSVRTYASIIHPDDREMVEQAVHEGTDQKKPFIIDYRVFHADGTVRWVYEKGQPVFGDDGKAVWVDGAIFDTTRAKELEHQIIIKNKMVSLGRVAAGMAHEIRNPLTGINSYLYTLEDLCDLETLTPDNFQMIRKIVEQIQVASNKIESVIRRVMDFSKPGTPMMALTDINTPVEEAINLSGVTLRKSGVKIKMDLSKDLPKCYADSQLIEQVILNLMNNAAKAMHNNEGSKMMEIRSSSRNNCIFLTVSDSGPGVPTELRDKIFDPFVTTENDGSGIGLSIAQRIIADHNGSIRVGTSKWGGAEFKIEFPIEKRMHPR
jgi:PAS domain S-box-containing protein